LPGVRRGSFLGHCKPVAERDSPPQKALFLGPRERIKEGGKSPVRWKGGEDRGKGERRMSHHWALGLHSLERV